MPNQGRLELNDFVQAWMEQTASVMSQVSSQNWTARVDAGTDSSADPGVSLCFSVAGGLSGSMALCLSPADAVRMSRQFTGIPYGDETELAGDDREALVELVRQIAGLVASAIKPRTGAVDFTGGEPTAMPWNTSSANRLKLRCGQEEIVVDLAIDSALLKALTPEPEPQTVVSATVHDYVRQGNLDLLMDVELGVTLRFGQRQMLLREILDLSSGAVVELDRQVQDPVDLLLDDKVIARGEVVIINGNYGLRVTELASPAQRIGSIQ